MPPRPREAGTRQPQTPAVPVALVLRRAGSRVQVRCPYCSGLHWHDRPGGGMSARRAPACGLVRPEVDRLTGYVITEPEEAGRG